MNSYQRLLFVSAITLCSACASVKQYSMSDWENLSATRERGVRISINGLDKYDDLTITGSLPGRLMATGDIPGNGDYPWLLMEYNEQTTQIGTETRSNFTLPLDAKIDLRNKAQESIPIKLTFPWREKLAQSGKAFQATPDSFLYVLRFAKDGQLEIVDSAGKTVQRIDLTISFQKVEDKARQKAFAAEQDEERRGNENKIQLDKDESSILNAAKKYLIAHNIIRREDIMRVQSGMGTFTLTLGDSSRRGNRIVRALVNVFAFLPSRSMETMQEYVNGVDHSGDPNTISGQLRLEKNGGSWEVVETSDSLR